MEAPTTGTPRAPSRLPALDFDGRRTTWVENLDRVGVHQLGAGIPKPLDNRPVHVRVAVLHDGQEIEIPVDLRAHEVGFGRRWSAACPRCGRGAAHLYAVGDSLICRSCSGTQYLSQAMTHKKVFRSVIRPLQRAGELERRARRRRTHRTMRQRLFAEARVTLERAFAGLARLGLPANDVTVLRTFMTLPAAGFGAREDR